MRILWDADIDGLVKIAGLNGKFIHRFFGVTWSNIGIGVLIRKNGEASK